MNIVGKSNDLWYGAPMAVTTRTDALARTQALPSWLAGQVAARGRRLVGAAIAAEGLRLPHHAVLATVSAHGPLAQADLARQTGIDGKDLVGLLNQLETAGMLVRLPDQADRRKNAIMLTGAGTRALDRCSRLAEDANAELLAPLTAAEARQLTALLAKLCAAGEAHGTRPGG
jgi:MarR family transcriptional regulator, lower aerobic nicotinate degradation pathway regulator